MKATVFFMMPEPISGSVPALAIAAPTMPPISAGRARRDAVVPGDDVRGDGAEEGAEDEVVVNHPGIDDALADGAGHLELKDEERDEVEEGRPGNRLVGLQHFGGDDGGDGVGGIVEAVHEVEQQGDDDQPGDDPEPDLYVFHGDAQAFSSTMPSTILATSSQRSVMDSSCS